MVKIVQMCSMVINNEDKVYGQIISGFRHPGTYAKKTGWFFLGTPTQKKPTLLL